MLLGPQRYASTEGEAFSLEACGGRAEALVTVVKDLGSA